MTRSKKLDLNALLTAADNAQVRANCRTCALSKDVLKQVEEAYALKEQNFPTLSWRRFTTLVAKPLGYPFGAEALKNHMEKCIVKK